MPFEALTIDDKYREVCKLMIEDAKRLYNALKALSQSNDIAQVYLASDPTLWNRYLNAEEQSAVVAIKEAVLQCKATMEQHAGFLGIELQEE